MTVRAHRGVQHSLSQDGTVVPNVKNLPKIRLKNSWNWWIILLTSSEYEVHGMTGNGSYLNMQQLAWKNGMENSCGHFFLKWANSSGHFLEVEFSWTLLVNSRWHFLSTRIAVLGGIFVNISLVNSSRHFWMVITNSTNTVGQPTTQGVQGRGENPARFSEHCSVSGQGVQGRSPC